MARMCCPAFGWNCARFGYEAKWLIRKAGWPRDCRLLQQLTFLHGFCGSSRRANRRRNSSHHPPPISRGGISPAEAICYSVELDADAIDALAVLFKVEHEMAHTRLPRVWQPWDVPANVCALVTMIDMNAFPHSRAVRMAAIACEDFELTA